MKLELPRDGLDATEQYKQIKNDILKLDLPHILADEQNNHNFPEDYDLIMTSKGKQTRRKLLRLDPNFFNIGNATRPTTFEFVAGDNWDIVMDAIRYAVQTFIRRAPALSGHYINSLDIQSNGTQVRGSGLNALATKLNRDDRIYVGPTAVYAAVLEAGHYTGYYANALRGGIIAYVSKQVRLKFGASVSCRLIYMTPMGARTMVPVLEFGVAGAFASNDTVPGKAARKRSSRAARRK